MCVQSISFTVSGIFDPRQAEAPQDQSEVPLKVSWAVDTRRPAAREDQSEVPLKVSCRIRFSHLGSHYDGTFGEEVGVSRVGECTLMAFKNKKIGFRIKVNEQKKTCALLTTFKRFTTLNDSNIRDYILTTSISDQVCTVNAAKNVTGFISGQCTTDRWDCELLEKMRDYCMFVGSDKPDCISSTGVSMEDVECPKGQNRVAVKKEVVLCCPEGEILTEQRNGKALCCPEKKVLKEVLNDTAICCAPTDNYEQGTGLCCPPRLVPSKSSSGSIGCCPSGRIYVNTQNGVDHCCPNGEEFGKREGGIDYCCPEGKIFQEVKNGQSICCSNGLTLKGYHNGIPQCCFADSNYDSASGNCCGKVASLDEWSLAATAKNKIGFRVTIKSKEKKEMTCAFLRQFSRFENRSDPNDYDFILDTKADDNVCNWNTIGIWTRMRVNIRFSHLGSHYDGTFGEEVTVSTAGECTLVAFNNKKIGFRIKVNEEKKTCALLMGFKRFTTLNDSNIRDYILTTSSTDQVCTTRNVTEFISGRCTLDGWDCELLEKMRDYCVFVGSDKPDCISSKAVSMDDIECPKGQHRVAVKKVALLCCPEGETLAEERNGKALCCPEKKVLKEVLNDTAICCAPTDNYEQGTGLCCPPRLVPSKSSSGSIGCCPSGRIYVNTQNGVDHCCPNGEEFGKREGGIDYCCPEGKIFQEVSCRIRFSHLGSHYDGTFGEEVGVSRVGECTLMAFKNKKIGFRIKVNEQKKTCALLTTFKRFTTLNDSNIRDYILTTSISDQVCTVNAAKNVTGFISGQCTTDRWDCELLEKMRDYCMFVGSDKPDCISSTGVSMEDVECPKGQNRVAVKKEVVLCCPEGEILTEQRNGKALCCPEKKVLKEVLNDTAICCDPTDNYEQGTGRCCPSRLVLSKSSSGSIGCCPKGKEFAKRVREVDYCCPSNKKLKGIFNGKSICCNPNDNYKTGTSFCCPTGKQYSSGNGLEHCCPSGLVPSKSISGSIGCCPSGRTYVKTQNGVDHCCPNTENFVKREGGIDYCCPNGETFRGKRGGAAICCPNGNIYKEHYNGNKICCPTTDNYKAATGRCCGSGRFYNKNNGVEACCPPNKYAAKAPNGYTDCCKGQNDNLYTFKPEDTTYMICCKPGTMFTFDGKVAECVKNSE
ncbi:hypothetical protein QR680_004262 [Steinernema hermaphroditum]|uniref:Uncharacterized protein n=1 Tax=Steinernema hermaphroditum TaxID=289476 RepID=A0AA39LTQ0_9BILA|nr:hypothetical protein QR680_004262 [Steinernema hermaphroditum]